MSERFENIDELFKNELGDYSPAVPHNMWKNIEPLLQKKQGKKAWLSFYKIAGSIALILATGSLGVYLFVNRPARYVAHTSETGIIEPTVQTPTIVVEQKQKTNFLGTSKDIKEPDIKEGEKLQPAFNAPETILIAEASIPTITEVEDVVSRKVVLTDHIEANNVFSNTTEKEIVFTRKDPATATVYEGLSAEFESTDDNKTKTAQWMIGGQAGPQYSYRKISSEHNTKEYLDSYDKTESGIVAYAGGINIAYKPTRRLSIQSGVYYSKIGQTAPAQMISNNVDNYSIRFPGSGIVFNNQETQPELRISTSLGAVSGSNSESLNNNDNNPVASASIYEGVSHVNQYLEFLEVPLIARYSIFDRKINFHLLGGMSTNFLIASPVYLDNGDYYTDTKNINKVNYSSTVGLGIGYNFSSNLKLNIEPQFKYYINKVNTGSTTSVHPFSLGVFTGFSYIF